MGSNADEAHSQKIAEAVRGFGIEAVLRVASAHKTPEHALEILRHYEAEPRSKVYVTVAGRSNALSGFADGVVAAPVIACPPWGEVFGGADILSSLRMPSGIAPAVVLEPSNAALLAAKILGVSDARVRAKVIEFQHAQANKIKRDDAEMNA
jgi:5-(carboxyamino)imidazole ribonucleotide mutase/phosphoribosylaminoimidazole-succinocarboxamide synthase